MGASAGQPKGTKKPGEGDKQGGEANKPSSGAKEGYQPGEGEKPDANKAEEYVNNTNDAGAQFEKPGEKTGTGASNDGKSEPGKYKGFRERFEEEVRKKAAGESKSK
ncbi:MAG: hypothetical protein H6839_17610 [Planctomycetes bacterium]|nr:hypothetical protein [Planctomycetota bacterium]